MLDKCLLCSYTNEAESQEMGFIVLPGPKCSFPGSPGSLVAKFLSRPSNLSVSVVTSRWAKELYFCSASKTYVTTVHKF